MYNMLQFSEQAEAEKGGDINAGMWRSRFAYRTRRFVNDSKSITNKQRLCPTDRSLLSKRH